MCGDRVIDPEEECDDGNDIDTDACRNHCRDARCGDGVVGPDEQCDGGAQCNPDCTFAAVCGNGVVEGVEQCDDGNDDPSDGCLSDCRVVNSELCGACDRNGTQLNRLAADVRQTKRAASDRDTSDLFGGSVAISGDIAIVGARRNDDAGDDSGSAYFFTRQPDGRWLEEKVTVWDAEAEDRFGTSVAISGDRAIVGAWGDDDNGEEWVGLFVYATGRRSLA